MIRFGRPNSVPTRAFTLVELLATISVIFLIMGIALVAYTSAVRTARSAADRAAVNGLRLAVGQFKAEFGFVPPLVKDEGDDNSTTPLTRVRGRTVPLVYSLGVAEDAARLRGQERDRPRYSLLSIPYYLLGALDGTVDGVDGLGFYEVRRDGTFAPSLSYATDPDRDPVGADEVQASGRSQRQYEPFFDTSRGGVELFTDPTTRFTGSNGVLTRNALPYRFELRDRAGIGIRYYRWAPDARPLDVVFRDDALTDISQYSDRDDSGGLDGEPGYYNVPLLVLNSYFDEPFATLNELSDAIDAAATNADADFPFPAELRSATYAIVAAGPNQLFGDERGADGTDTEMALVNDAALRRRFAEQLDLSEARLSSDADYRAQAIRLAMEDNIVEVGS